MRHFPVFLDLNRRRCLVVGGGEVAARKAQQLLRSNADILIVAPRSGDAVKTLEQQGRVKHKAREFQPKDVAGCALVIAATADKEVNGKVAAAARAENVPVNVVDNPALCSFIMPSVVDRDPVQDRRIHGRRLAGPGPPAAGETRDPGAGNLRAAGDRGAGVPRPGQAALPGFPPAPPVLGEYPPGTGRGNAVLGTGNRRHPGPGRRTRQCHAHRSPGRGSLPGRRRTGRSRPADVPRPCA